MKLSAQLNKVGIALLTLGLAAAAQAHNNYSKSECEGFAHFAQAVAEDRDSAKPLAKGESADEALEELLARFRKAAPKIFTLHTWLQDAEDLNLATFTFNYAYNPKGRQLSPQQFAEEALASCYEVMLHRAAPPKKIL